MAASDFIAALGPGTMGAVVSGMVWKGADWLNKNASPQAKRDVSDFVLHYEKHVDLTAVTRHLPQLFDRVYGARHSSWTCFWRSIATSALYFATFAAVFTLRPDLRDEMRSLFLERYSVTASVIVGTTMFVIFTGIPDYLALWKSRVLLRWSCRARNPLVAVIAPLLDVLLSLLIITVLIALSLAVEEGGVRLVPRGIDAIGDMYSGLRSVVFRTAPHHKDDVLGVVFWSSTFLTSIWAIGVSVSALLLRFAATLGYPLKLLRWLFKEDDGLLVIGTMMAALTWLGFLIYGLL